MKLSLRTAILVTVVAGAFVVGCGAPDYPADYSHEIKKTDADKAREKELMKNTKEPGGLTPGVPLNSQKAGRPGGK